MLSLISRKNALSSLSVSIRGKAKTCKITSGKFRSFSNVEIVFSSLRSEGYKYGSINIINSA